MNEEEIKRFKEEIMKANEQMKKEFPNLRIIKHKNRNPIMNKQRLLALYTMIERELPTYEKADGILFLNEIMFDIKTQDYEAYTQLQILFSIYTREGLTLAHTYIKILLSYTYTQQQEEIKLCQTIMKNHTKHLQTELRK